MYGYDPDTNPNGYDCIEMDADFERIQFEEEGLREVCGKFKDNCICGEYS